MSSNRFGERFAVTTFGESHGPALGAVVDGCPAGVPFDEALLRHRLARRRPGDHGGPSGALVSARNEEDAPEVLSGVYEGRTLGTPIAIVIRNRDARPEDYAAIAASPRNGHADDLWRDKFGHSDPRGGGRASGRETAARVAAAAVAEMWLRRELPALSVTGYACRIGPFALEPEAVAAIASETDVDAFPARFPSARQSAAVEALLREAKSEGKSWGGIVELRIDGVPRGTGAPIFGKLKAKLAEAFLSVGATAGVELGAGFAAAGAEGSVFHAASVGPGYGGLRGGIATGERIVARIALKPTATVLDVAKRGRHDPCIVPRAIPVLEAMAYLVLADLHLARRLDRA